MAAGLARRAWMVLAALGVLYFLITAGTYASLGVVLPAMVRDGRWNWAEGGLGFTLLGIATGGSSFATAYLIRKLGVRPTLACGMAAMSAGFVCLGTAHAPWLYFGGTTLCGVGFQMMALIPGTHVLASAFPRRGLPFGVYFMSGSAGGVAGPMMALFLVHALHGAWRGFWYVQAGLMILVGLACLILVGSPRWLAARAAQTDRHLTDEKAGSTSARVYRTPTNWTARQAIRTPQFYVLLAAYFAHLFVWITISSFSVAHLTERGVTLKAAGLMLGLEALVATIGRAVCGVLGDWLDPRWLLLFALAMLAGGAFSLSLAHGQMTLLLYAIGSGFGIGVTPLAITLLLLNYYGRKHNLEIFSLTCMIGAVSALGSVFGGLLRDATGGFAGAFQVCAVLIGCVAIGAALMRPPRRSAAGEPSDEARENSVGRAANHAM